jgi:hypothetical protein
VDEELDTRHDCEAQTSAQINSALTPADKKSLVPQELYSSWVLQFAQLWREQEMLNITGNQTEPSVEIIRQLIKQLPLEQRGRLRLLLDEDLGREDTRPPDPATPPIIPPDEFAAKWDLERRWLEENSQQYAGRWVALEGDQLLATGSSAREVYAALKAGGISGSLVTRVEHPDDLPVIE